MATKKIPPIVKFIKKYKLPQVNYSFQKTISYSQLSTFVSCPKKWELQYKDGHYISEPSINTIFGSSMHLIIQQYLTLLYEKNMVEADKLDLEEEFKEKFKNEYKEVYEKNKKIHFQIYKKN